MAGNVAGGLAWLDPQDPVDAFPDPETALPEPDGLLAAGGDLKPERLLAAYSRGIFPWYETGQPILWWSPDPRAIILIGQMHISRSLRRLLRQNRYAVSIDQDCAAVIDGCARPREGQPGTWITREMQAAYVRLHELGHVHSIEVWQQQILVGGLYGVAVGGVFCGESMFSEKSGASKVAMACLDSLLLQAGFQMFDCQMFTPHLSSLGAILLPRQQFLQRLGEFSGKPVGRQPWPANVRPSAEIAQW